MAILIENIFGAFRVDEENSTISILELDTDSFQKYGYRICPHGLHNNFARDCDNSQKKVIDYVFSELCSKQNLPFHQRGDRYVIIAEGNRLLTQEECHKTHLPITIGEGGSIQGFHYAYMLPLDYTAISNRLMDKQFSVLDIFDIVNYYSILHDRKGERTLTDFILLGKEIISLSKPEIKEILCSIKELKDELKKYAKLSGADANLSDVIEKLKKHEAALEPITCHTQIQANRRNKRNKTDSLGKHPAWPIKKLNILREELVSKGFISEKTKEGDFLYVFGERNAKESKESEDAKIHWTKMYGGRHTKRPLLELLQRMGYNLNEIKPAKMNGTFKVVGCGGFSPKDFGEIRKSVAPVESSGHKELCNLIKEVESKYAESLIR